MSELATVVWKEWREHFLRKGRPSRTVIGALVMVVLGGIIVPLVLGTQLAPSTSKTAIVQVLMVAGLVAAAFQGFVVTASLIIDAFAGERERHTLETLLAGPLSDRAILVGKVGAIQLFVFVSAFVEMLAQQAIALILLGPVALGYAPILLAGPLLAVLVGLLFGSIGAIVGMRVATVKNGQQVMAYIMLPIYLLPSFGGMLLQRTPVGRAVMEFYDVAGPVLFAVVAFAALAVLDAVLLEVARRSFRRPRLLLKK